MSPEVEGRIPENLIPKDQKGNALWKWLKELLRKAADKFADKNSATDDPDKKQAKDVVKNLKQITDKVKTEQAEASKKGETPEEDVHAKFPPHLLDVMEAIQKGGLLDKYEKQIIEKVANVASGALGVDKAIIQLGILVVHESRLDRAIARKVLPRIREAVISAMGRAKLNQGTSATEEDVTQAETVTREMENILQEEAQQQERQPRRNREDQEDERDPDDNLDRYTRDDMTNLETRLKAGMQKKDLMWFYAIKSPEAFEELFDARVREIRARVEAKGESYDETAAREEVSKDATEFVMNSLMTIYSPILDEEPSDYFDSQAKNAGNQYSNPDSAAKTFSKMLNTLRERSKVLSMSNSPVQEAMKKKIYSRLEKQRMTVKNEQTGQLEEVLLPTTQLEAVDIGSFAEYLREAFDSGEGTIEFGHNFKLITARGPREEKGEPGSFFRSIEQYAGENFTSDAIDTAFRLPHNDIVQAAKQKFQSSYARMLLDNGWQKDPMIAEKFLQSMPATERRVKEELREQFKSQDVPDWAIEWAFQMGRTMYFGLDFGFHEIMSYADPDLKYDGKTTFIGMGHMRGYFDMWESAKLLNAQRKDLHMAKAVWLPYTLELSEREYDHKKWSEEGEARWRDSFTMGKMGFAGSFLDGHKLFIDMGNITGAGGWGTNQGWRNRESYNMWLLDEFTGNTQNRLEVVTKSDPTEQKIEEQKLVRSWKRLENIGITISENFMQQYVIAIANDKDNRTDAFMNSVDNLSDFWFDRYFSDDGATPNAIGAELLKDIPTKDHHGHEIKNKDKSAMTKKELWRHHIHHVITDSHDNGARKDGLFKVMHKITTVQTFEQMPALFMTMEKQRATEYGVTMLSEMQDYFLKEVKREGTGQEKEAKKRNDDALADLIYAQEQMRIDVSEQMEANHKIHGNLYGDKDLSRLRSSVRNGKGNVIDEEYIGEVLERRFSEETDEAKKNKRIADAKYAYNFIKRRLTEQVTMDDIRKNAELVQLEVKAENAKKVILAANSKEDKKKAEAVIARFKAIEEKVAHGKIKTRINWWANALDENLFGHAVTQPSVAMKFVHVSATGPDTVKRDARQAADTSELMHQVTQKLYSAVKKAAFTAKDKGAHAGFELLSEWIREFKGPVQGELGSDVSYPVVFRTAQLIDLFFKKDDEANRWWKFGPQRYWSAIKKRSISDSLIDEGAPVWAWDRDLEHAWAEHLHHKGQLKRKASTGDKHREVPDNSLINKILKKIPGLKNKVKDTKWVHDNVNTINYHSLFEWSNSGYGQLFKYNYIPAMIGFLIAVGALSAKKGSEDLDVAGGGGGGRGGGGGHH